MSYLFYALAAIAAIEAVVIFILSFLLQKRTYNLRRTSLVEQNHKKHISIQQKEKEKHIRTKLHLTQRLNLQLNHSTESQAFYSYASQLNQLYTDLREIFFPQIITLKEQYPMLNNIDITLIILLGMGYSNQEISAIFNYSKLTIYKRRQNIGRLLSISPLQLDEYAKNLVNPQK